MERARRRKLKSAAGFEGVGQSQKHKAVTRLSSDSCSYNIDEDTRDNMFTLELGQNSLGQATGKSRAKLLADEIYKKVKSKRRSPSVFAKLFGLEGLPSLWHVHRQQKKLSDTYPHKNVSTFVRPNRQLHDGRSNRRSSMQRRELNEAHEDPEASHFVGRRRSSRWSASSMLTKSEMALIQKFIDARRLSVDESTEGKLWDSKELDDSLDIVMKFDQQPDTFSVNHLHDPQVNPISSVGSHTAALKPSASAKYDGNAKARTSKRDVAGKHNITSHPRREDDLLLEPDNRRRAHTSCQSSSIQLEDKNESNTLPTRIFVLRPNIGNMQNAGESGPSADHSHGYAPSYRKPKESAGVEKVSWRKKDSYYDMAFSRPVSREAKEIAREITRRMRGGDETLDAKSSGFRGYAGDDSLYDARESAFDSESKKFKLSSRNSFGDTNKWGSYQSSSSVEWSVNREAKKRLSERWRITQRYQDLEIVDDGSTLGEMLAIADGETRSKHLNAKTSHGRASARLGSINEGAMWDAPLGLSSRDGWKDEIRRTSFRSRSVPPSLGRRSQRGDTYDEILTQEKHLMRSDPIDRHRSKVAEGYLSHKSQDSNSRSKKPLPFQHIYINEMDSFLEANFELQMEANVKDLSEQHLTFQVATKDDSSRSRVSAEHGSATLSSKSSLLHPNQSSTKENYKAAGHDQEISNLKEQHKVADHAGPVSIPVIEDTPFTSESFERINAELKELRMQLQILKMESGQHADEPAPVTAEEDIAEVENYLLGTEGWEVSYILDVLMHSGIQDSDLDMFGMMWYSPDSPLDPMLFDELEKRYTDEITRLRSERRLLFDGINSALLETFQQHIDSYSWAMPKSGRLHSTWQKEQVVDALDKLMNQEPIKGQVTSGVIYNNMDWPDLRGEIDIIGNDMEKLLIDDMITEILCC
ncbi:uncharacterized protein LOC105161437 isoform X1 [Sesamum indicum]|uniref:Uncharacterized protein LOC105161437 isoform X1 n=1 Tax=Sesamum indicum TaxID=4182 RepID=A0A6I9T5L6_SESIN|nr:uncharacterized protein LOC105161437 isoform X1 [Sesamum indicum]XP_011077424.1 uncharacterized protein LOC105161437 isoform X1 [Sesamum indicum]XP_011077425.1 uncharacterized protein LOC105161437 isoform X1 [Sesamum indicum]XP_011077427.1 uncharacterized protein LOC105161437 isoform X1 [Sesamum indicum]XP_011077428.1 uncharacterized protein LOC105161437 isoform X1 [Sesamum indicum]XP_011077429.1 uncharacterized protein LOC105161437 isoform X1 [Sesamum indicum]XP_011077430.1 uncharacterize